MLVQVVQAIKIGGHSFKKGIVEIPDALLKSATGLKCIKAGYIAESDKPVLSQTESVHQRNLRLAARIEKQLEANAKARAKLDVENDEKEKEKKKTKEKA
jgi:hypothetical protein